MLRPCVPSSPSAFRNVAMLAVVFVSAGCPSSSIPDASAGPDASAQPHRDAGVADAAQTSAPDASFVVDAGMQRDGGDARDGGTDTTLTDAGSVNVITELDAFGRIVVYPGTLLVDDCGGCDDADGDGLSDAAEATLLSAIVPQVRLADDEPALMEAGSAVRAVGRVVRAAGGERIRVFIMLGYARDYGSCGFTAHAGDSERVAFEFDIDGAPMSPRLTMRRAYTAAHEGELSDRSRLIPAAELAGVLAIADDASTGPRPAVFSSHNKHATYVSASACAEAFALPCFVETCAADMSVGTGVLPPIVNAGEPDAPLVSDLSALGFPGEDAWAEIEFCGGQRDENGDIDEGCSSPVREKLLNDPFL